MLFGPPDAEVAGFFVVVLAAWDWNLTLDYWEAIDDLLFTSDEELAAIVELGRFAAPDADETCMTLELLPLTEASFCSLVNRV